MEMPPPASVAVVFVKRLAVKVKALLTSNMPPTSWLAVFPVKVQSAIVQEAP